MPYLTVDQLNSLSFKKLGQNVKISDRASLYHTEEMEIGNNCRIDDFCVISGKIILGNYIHIAAFCLIAGGEKGIIAGDYTGISYGARIFSQSDDYSGEHMFSPLIPAEYKNEKKAAVILERHVILGANSVVFPGVHIAEGCSIGAMALVTRNTQPWGIYTGIPAKRIKEKSRELLKLEKKFIASSIG